MSDGGRLYIDFEAAAAAGAIVLGGDRATHSEWVRPLDHLSPPTPPGQAMVAHPARARAQARGRRRAGRPRRARAAQHAGGGRMCQFFLEGRCIYGHGCRYSHGIPPGALGVAPAHAQHHVISSVPLGGHPQLAHIPAYFAYSPPITPPPASVSPPAPTHYEWPFITIDPSERHLLVHALQGDVSIASLIAVARAKFQKAAVPADQGAPPHAVLVGALFGWCASVSKRIRLDLDGASAAGWLVRGGMRPFEWVAVPLSPGIAAMHAHHHHHLPPQYYAQAGGLAHASVMAMPPGPPAGHAPLVAPRRRGARERRARGRGRAGDHRRRRAAAAAAADAARHGHAREHARAADERRAAARGRAARRRPGHAADAAGARYDAADAAAARARARGAGRARRRRGRPASPVGPRGRARELGTRPKARPLPIPPRAISA